MAQFDQETENRIKESFKKVKEDIDKIFNSLNDQKQEINEIKDKINLIFVKLSEISSKKENKDQKRPIFDENSTGNKGVTNDQQYPTMTNDAQQSRPMTTNQQPMPTTLQISKNSIFDPSLLAKFNSLTDREFSIFVSIYDILKEKPEVSYFDLAQKLTLTEDTMRSATNRLISKGIPVIKERFFNKKVSLLLPEDLQNPQLLSELMKIRQKIVQKTLFSFN